MPELPEVETVRRGLAPAMEGRRFAHVRINRPDLRWPLPVDMAARLTGARVERLDRRSKYLLAELSTGQTLLMHLGMSGRMLVSSPPDTVPGASGQATPEPGHDTGQIAPGRFHHAAGGLQKHDHVVFDMTGGARIVFNDARRFGAMDLVATEALSAHPWLAQLGPEPLGNGFSPAYLAERLAGRRTPIKAALLDQRIVAGLGNIYVCEALHRAGIAPRRQAGRIAQQRIARLAAEIRTVLVEAIAAGGSSLRDYRQAGGELGYFQHDFRVYGREGQPCASAGCTGRVARIVQSGRSTFHCPQCQR